MNVRETILRTQLKELLGGGQAHADIRAALADFPFELTGERPAGLPYSAWQLLEHMRIALHDLRDFVTNPEYEAPEWPAAYWPNQVRPESSEAWIRSVDALHADPKAFIDMVEDQDSNLYDVIPWADNGQTLLREVLLAADHTSYHTGEMIVLRRLLGIWNN